MLRAGTKASIEESGFLNHVESIRFWPWGLITLSYEGVPYLLDQNNFAIALSPKVDAALQAWSDPSNHLDPDKLGSLVQVKPSQDRGSSAELWSLNLDAMKKAHQSKRKIFGSAVTAYPGDHPSFGSKFFGAISTSESAGSSSHASIHFGFPNFFVIDWSPLAAGAQVNGSADALSAQELAQMHANTFEIAMGSEVVGLMVGQDGKSYTLVDSPFYFWPQDGRLQTCSEREVASMLRIPCALRFPGVNSYSVRITGTS